MKTINIGKVAKTVGILAVAAVASILPFSAFAHREEKNCTGKFILTGSILASNRTGGDIGESVRSSHLNGCQGKYADVEKKDVPRYAGALTFAPDGTLFVGDNISSAVFAYKTGQDQPEQIDPKAPPLEVESIDDRIAPVVRGKLGKIEINGMAVHPTSRVIYL